MAINCIEKFFLESTNVIKLTPNADYIGSLSLNDVDYYEYDMLKNETMTYRIDVTPHTTNSIDIELHLYRYQDGELLPVGISYIQNFYNEIIYDGLIGEYYFCLKSSDSVDYTLNIEFTDYPFILFPNFNDMGHGAWVRNIDIPEPPPPPCLEPIAYFIIGGALPTPLLMTTGGFISGFIPEQDCFSRPDIKPSFAWRSVSEVFEDRFVFKDMFQYTDCELKLAIDPYVETIEGEFIPESVVIDLEPIETGAKANVWSLYAPVYNFTDLRFNIINKNGSRLDCDLELSIEEMPPFLSLRTWQKSDIVDNDFKVGEKLAITETYNYPVEIRAYFPREPETYIDGIFYICVINNWDLDLKAYLDNRINFQQQVFIKEWDKGEEPKFIEPIPEPIVLPLEEEAKGLCDNCLILPEYQGLVSINSNGMCVPCPEPEIEEGLRPIENDNPCDPCVDEVFKVNNLTPLELCPCDEPEIIEIIEEPIEGIAKSCMEDYVLAMDTEKTCDPYGCEPKDPIYPDLEPEEDNRVKSQCDPCEHENNDL